MTVAELAKLVAECRAAQRTYFRTPSGAALAQSKSLERKVDQTVRSILEEPDLFPAAVHSDVKTIPDVARLDWLSETYGDSLAGLLPDRGQGGKGLRGNIDGAMGGER